MSQYFRLRTADVHRTWAIDGGTLVDIDSDGHPVGIEILADEVQMVDFVEVLIAIADRAVIPVHDPVHDEPRDESEDREAGLGQESENRGDRGHGLTVSDEEMAAAAAAAFDEFDSGCGQDHDPEQWQDSAQWRAAPSAAYGARMQRLAEEDEPTSESRNGPRRMMPSERTRWRVQCKQCGESYDMLYDNHVCS